MPEPPIHDQCDATSVQPSAANANGGSVELTCQMPIHAAGAIDTEEFSELLKLSQPGGFSKQERDFAFAAQLIRGKHIGERRLRHALRGWTTFGELTLQEFLQRKGVLSEDNLSRVENATARYLQSLQVHQSWKSWSPTVAGRTSWLLERVDSSGRVAKVFGLSRIPKAHVGNESRTFTARFRLVRKLGQGGLGIVWLAVDTNLNRYVAIKEITGQGSQQPSAIGRFRREAEITGRLDHPNIVPIHLLGENQVDGRIFYVMRFLGNQTLEDAIRQYHERRELGQEDSLAFHRLLMAFVSICQAVAYAHSRKVIHRDLKPQNIALDDFGQVIVLDWGLAKTLGEEEPVTHLQNIQESQTPDNLDVTLAGQVLGTPLYMAPEQASGRIDEIDELTDGYGLGAILFAILTGCAPHEVSNESLGAGSQLSALLDAIVERPPPPVRQLNPNISAGLEAICLKALAKERYARYPSASALADDVQRWMADEPIAAQLESTSKRMRRWVGKHPRLTQTLAALIAIATAVLVMWGLTAYQGVVTADQLKLQTAIDESRELKNLLTSEFESLAKDVELMSALPAVQGLIDARAGRDETGDALWSEQLRSTFRSLLRVNSGYAAVTCWVQKSNQNGQPVRIEIPESHRGRLRTDLTAFFARHLPGINELARGEVYIGIPGRLLDETEAASDAVREAVQNSTEPVGLCLVAGAGVYSQTTNQKSGGVAIECDLESILSNHLNSVHNHIQEIYVTNRRGQPAMRYTRARGLRPIDPTIDTGAEGSRVLQFFADTDAREAIACSSNVCAAKVPLTRYGSDRFVGLLIRFRQ